jgi:SAM-dependent methyltransferase
MPSPRSPRSWQADYREKFYASRPGWIDGTQQFHLLCRRFVQSGRPRILEVGAGPSNPTSRFLATLGELHGLDPSPDVNANDALASASVLKDDRYPFADGTFDMCVANYVVEHVSDPVAHMAEIHRVLRPGGSYLFRTPNRYHYVAVVAGATPHWFHELVANRLRNLPAEDHGLHRVYYRMNTKQAVERLASRTGFAVEQLQMVEKEPSYGMAVLPLFMVFMAYERLVNSSDALSFLRANIFAALRKHGQPNDVDAHQAFG